MAAAPKRGRGTLLSAKKLFSFQLIPIIAYRGARQEREFPELSPRTGKSGWGGDVIFRINRIIETKE